MPRLSASDPNYGRTLGSRLGGASGSSMPAYQPQPQSYSQSTTSYAQAPSPQADPYNEQRYQGLYAASQKADPYAAQRGGYLSQLQQMSAPGYEFKPTDPSYAFRFKQGQGALESSLAAQGLLGAGAAGLELQKYGQEAGAQEFQAQFDRLQQLAGMGDPAAAAKLEQEAVEGRYRTYQPQMMETGRTSTEYGFPGAGGGGGGGRNMGTRTGASRTTGSAVADLLGRLGAGSSKQLTEQMMMQARAQDIASGYDTLPGWGAPINRGTQQTGASTYAKNLGGGKKKKSLGF